MTDSSPIILFAPNIYSGGGLVLLKELLKYCPPNKTLSAFVDIRNYDKLTFPSHVKIRWLSAHILSYLTSQFKLYLESSEDCTIICFNSLPPLFPTRGKVIVFLQNRLLIEDLSNEQYPLKTSVSLMVKRLIIWLFRYRVSEYIVQTNSMEQLLNKWSGEAKPPLVKIIPFASTIKPVLSKSPPKNISDYTFLYIADGLPHKNHERLLNAWCILHSKNIKPKLLLTIWPTDSTLLKYISQIVTSRDIQIENIGNLSHTELLSVLADCDALIYPSLIESFGLPLIEAHQLNKPIIAGELDYIRDVCMPTHTFDPYSPISIARAVRRFMSIDEEIVEAGSAGAFWEEILKSRR